MATNSNAEGLPLGGQDELEAEIGERNRLLNPEERQRIISGWKIGKVCSAAEAVPRDAKGRPDLASLSSVTRLISSGVVEITLPPAA